MPSLPHPRKLILFTALSLADLALTCLLLQRAGGAYESNPVAAWWLANFGWAGLAGFKFALVLSVAALVAVVSRYHPRAGGRVLAFGCSALLAVVLYSGSLVRSVGVEAAESAGAEPGRSEEVEYLGPDDAVDGLDRRAAEKQRLARDVAEGRLPLAAAAARFRDLDEAPPGFPWDSFRHAFPGSSDEERHCWEVIVFVRATVPGGPAGEPALVECLEAELQECISHGDLRLTGGTPETSPRAVPSPGLPIEEPASRRRFLIVASSWSHEFARILTNLIVPLSPDRG